MKGPSAQPEGDASRVAPSVVEIALRFAQFGLRGFGGLIAHGRYFFVEDRRWLNDAQFTEIFSVVQALPGANFVGMSIIMGDRFRGVPGAIADAAGLCIPTLTLAIVLRTFARFTLHNALLSAVEAACAGQIIAVGLHIARSLLARPAALVRKAGLAGITVFAVALTAGGVLLPVVVLALLAPRKLPSQVPRVRRTLWALFPVEGSHGEVESCRNHRVPQRGTFVHRRTLAKERALSVVLRERSRNLQRPFRPC